MVGCHNGANEQLKLADFGIATLVKSGQLLTEKCGTPAFMSPEQHLMPPNGSSKGYTYPVDVWAAGVIFHCLVVGEHPFLKADGEFDIRSAVDARLDFGSA